MIIGTDKLNYAEIKRFVGKPQDLVAYTTSLVPIWARHVEAIVNNQRYFTAIHVRNMLSISFKQRQELVNALIKDISITGDISNFTSILDILEACDKTKLCNMLEIKINGK